MTLRRSIQLVCFPYAGASAAFYYKWRRGLPSWIELVAIEPPGHGRRLSEPLETTVSDMVDRVMSEVRVSAATPFALFGHSLGALLAFEVGMRLRHERAADPLMLFASGTHAPSQRPAEGRAHLTSDEALRAELASLDGTPPAVLADPELMALALPILRADFQAAASYTCAPDRRLRCPIQVIGGTTDQTTPETLSGWRDHTERDFYLNMFPGGHFFIHQHEQAVLRLIAERLSLSLMTSRDPSGRTRAPVPLLHAPAGGSHDRASE